MVDMGKRFYPFIPVSLLQRDRYNSIKKIKKINSPILVLHGKADTLVPYYMAKKYMIMLMNRSIHISQLLIII